MKRTSSLLAFLGKIEGLPVAAVLVVLYGVFIITAPMVFTGYRIYMSFLQTVPPVLVCALGLTLVITAGEIDLSFPAVVAFSGFIFAWVFKNFAYAVGRHGSASCSPLPAALWSGISMACSSRRFSVPSIMATLAAQFFWYGVTVLLANGLQLNIKEVTTHIVHTIFVGRIGWRSCPLRHSGRWRSPSSSGSS